LHESAYFSTSNNSKSLSSANHLKSEEEKKIEKKDKRADTKKMNLCVCVAKNNSLSLNSVVLTTPTAKFVSSKIPF
jgi:hypothetical protein